MRKLFFVVIFVIMIFFAFIIPRTNAESYSTFESELEVIDNKENKSFNVYVLLPKEYIVYAINNAKMNIEYDGANTLKQNTIPGIIVDKEDVLDETYQEDGIEYVQILLNANSDNKYTFSILSEYEKMDFRYRIKNSDIDYILYMDNFKIDNGVCEAKYSYDTNELKQPDKKILKFNIIPFIILILFIIVIVIYQKRKGQ